MTHASTHDDSHVHVIPVRTLLAVFGTLIALTGITVAAAELPLGEWDAAVAIGIATIKASLVCLIFMHLKYDNAFHGLMLLFAVVFVALFLALTLLDEEPASGQTGDAAVVQLWAS
jgi:cytochrome c oxidase subunit 4